MDDILPAIRSGLSVDGKLYAAPFYGESSMLMYRSALAQKAGVTFGDRPSWPAAWGGTTFSFTPGPARAAQRG